MDQHKSLGSSIGDGTQVQHRMCYLCPEPGYYFNNEALSAHCKEAHISCYVCNSQTIFFIDQASLVEHVKELHICCPVCSKVTGQTIGFLSVIELKAHAHVEHPNEKIDYVTLAKQAITSQACYYGATVDGFDQTTTEHDNMSRREAFDEIDNLLRNRYSTERHLYAPSFNPKTENYILNFPSIEGTGINSCGDDDVNLFPSSTKYRMFTGGNISNAQYDQEFPGLAIPTLAKNNSGVNTLATVASSVKYKPQNWSQPNQVFNLIYLLNNICLY